jgi:hypothetical protein
MACSRTRNLNSGFSVSKTVGVVGVVSEAAVAPLVAVGVDGTLLSREARRAAFLAADDDDDDDGDDDLFFDDNDDLVGCRSDDDDAPDGRDGDDAGDGIPITGFSCCCD